MRGSPSCPHPSPAGPLPVSRQQWRAWAAAAHLPLPRNPQLPACLAPPPPKPAPPRPAPPCCRGLADGDVAVIDMEIKREGDRTPLPGLQKDGFFFDTESDPLSRPPPHPAIARLRARGCGSGPGLRHRRPVTLPGRWRGVGAGQPGRGVLARGRCSGLRCGGCGRSGRLVSWYMPHPWGGRGGLAAAHRPCRPRCRPAQRAVQHGAGRVAHLHHALPRRLERGAVAGHRGAGHHQAARALQVGLPLPPPVQGRRRLLARKQAGGGG
jgi:hypothetical protein